MRSFTVCSPWDLRGACLLLGVLAGGCSSTVGPMGPVLPAADGGTVVSDAPAPGDTEADGASPDDGGGMVTPTVDSGRGHGPCTPTVGRHGENTDALCSNGVDDDCNGYTDCDDFNCSRNPAVTVCADGGAGFDAGPPPPPYDGGSFPDVVVPPGTIGPLGGTVSRMRFGVFGDARPASPGDTAGYPAAVVGSVMDGMASTGAQFAIGTGDYMFASNATEVNAQLAMLRAAEGRFPNHVFHGLGNHECTGASASNCPNGNETANMQGYRSQLAPGYAAPYYDFMVHTDLGDAHFVITAPNAWSTTQQSWLTSTLAQPARYTIVAAHEPAGEREAPGSAPIEAAIAARAGGVTLRLYGHTHEYRHLSANAVINGNAGAPLSSMRGTYGFAVVEQRSDGNLVFTAYDVGTPPMVSDTFVLAPDGSLTR